jgi:hypothetical protein
MLLLALCALSYYPSGEEITQIIKLSKSSDR